MTDKEEILLRAELAAAIKERDKAISSRKSTWTWIESKYGKAHDWARKTLPEPWRTQYFGCIANGLATWDDHGEAYMCKAGFMVTPGNYFSMGAQEQLLFDLCERAEDAEVALAEARELCGEAYYHISEEKYPDLSIQLRAQGAKRDRNNE
jgi:hypothetical protein